MIGIYAIVNLANGKHYVGQSIDVYRRFNKHRSNLNLGRHNTPHLQNAWNKYGSDLFRFVVLSHAERDSELLYQQEDFWMRACRDRGIALYNTAPSSRSRLGCPMTEENKLRQSLARKGKPQPEKRNISYSKTMRGRPKPAAWRELMKTRCNGFKPGMTPWNKGKKNTISEAGRKAIGEATRRRFSEQRRAQCCSS